MIVSDEVIQQAFALSRARGAGLLSLLGDFDVWHGDLSEMRDDSPRQMNGEEPGKKQKATTATTAKNLTDVLMMARAIELLDADCRTFLARTCEPNDNAPEGAVERRSTTINEDKSDRVPACKGRLLELYKEVHRHATDSATPEWVTEREHAAFAASRNRTRG